MVLPWISFGCKCPVFKKQKVVIPLLSNDIYNSTQGRIVLCTFRISFLEFKLFYNGLQCKEILKHLSYCLEAIIQNCPCCNQTIKQFCVTSK